MTAGIDVEARAGHVRERLERAARAVRGLQYAMTDASELRFEHALGLADLGSSVPAAAGTLFMAASCKVVTAAAILDLASGARVALDAPLAEYYADQPYGRGPTVRQLLTHTAGIPNPLPLNWLHRIEDTTFDEDRALAAVMRANARLRSPPGQRYLYSNLGYWLLGPRRKHGNGEQGRMDCLRCPSVPLKYQHSQRDGVRFQTCILSSRRSEQCSRGGKQCV